MTARAAGARWEEHARRELERAGLRPIAHNWHCRYGEIDLIMQDGEDVVFVEVRYRAKTAHGDGLASVGSAKRERLVRSAELFLAANPALARRACRFDVVAIDGSDPPRFTWQRSAFEAL